jgi:hypothetical protein
MNMMSKVGVSTQQGKCEAKMIQGEKGLNA